MAGHAAGAVASGRRSWRCEIEASIATIAPSPETSLAPVAPQERIETLDILRGFALFCIFAVNWCVNSLWGTGRWQGFSTGADRIAYEAITFLLDEKSWPMFSFMFGLGFAIQMERAEARARPFVGTYARRLLGLFFIGVAHFILTERDILFYYAVLGFLLLPLRRLKLNLLPPLAFICMLIPYIHGSLEVHSRVQRAATTINARAEIKPARVVLDTYVGEYELASGRTIFVFREGDALFSQMNGWPPFRLYAASPNEFFMRAADVRISFLRNASDSPTGLVHREGGETVPGRIIQPGPPVVDKQALRRVARKPPTDRLYTSGTFLQIVSFRQQLFWERVSDWGTYGDLFPPFLLGLYAGRRRIFRDLHHHLGFVRKVMWWCLLFGLAGTAAITVWRELYAGATVFPFMPAAAVRLGAWIGAPLLGVAYLAGLTLLLQHAAWKKFLGPLGAVGRMALTNYLLQSVAYVLLFFGYGLGWYGQVGAFGALMLGLPVFALQIVGSQWWLKRFRFGPAEWMWRSATYGKWQAMRLEPLPLAAGVGGAK